MMEFIRSHIEQFTGFDYAILMCNFLVLLFSKRIASTIPGKRRDQDVDMRLIALRAITILLFVLYLIGFMATDLLQKIGKTALTLLVAYLASHVFHAFTLQRFGRVREVDGESFRSESYQSEVFHILGLLLVMVTAVVAIINIWELTSWLKTTSALGALLIITYSTKDVWAPDNINGLILLYNDTIQTGSVVRCGELDLLGVVIEITLTQTSIRDLRQRHMIQIPNSRFRNAKLEILSNTPSKGLVQYIDYNLAYGLTSEQVVAFFEDVFQAACKRENALNPDSKVRVRVFSTGDHAITWRVFFTVRNVYKTLSAEYAFNRAAYDLSLERGIGLNTPLTHLLEQTRIPPVFEHQEEVRDPSLSDDPSA